jgi:uncharacterized protein DUF6883
MKLPNAAKAIVDERKVREYLLSPSHTVGRFKARFFGSIGFPPEAWLVFVTALQRLAAEGEAEVVEQSEYGQKFVVRGQISGPGARPAEVESVWIVQAGDDRPRLVTVYPR